ncbi:F-box/LRR-repeat protein 2-like [Temnothorax curvispinosus]|uniref:F-box/LRR-repeat protein 2-like n=1 Tax=Temnothorax curvispinosus TaxID=300111 RepID=A0A6J1PRY2_9HYME|nr:F-box/LRR-repeat protein 2-like [Temnothorax curvispinosus]
MLRLQFISNSCTQLDAVMLIGTSKLIFPKNPEDKSITNLLHRIRAQRHSCSERFCPIRCSEEFSRIEEEPFSMAYYLWGSCKLFDPYNTTRDYENAYLDILDLLKEFPKYCVIYKSDIATNFHKSKLAHNQVFWKEDVPSSKQGYVNHPLLRNHWNYVKFIEDIKLSSGESKEQRDSFSTLSDEIILMILKYLDIRSFCRMSKVNKRLNNLTQDSFFFKCLNLRNLKKVYYKDSFFCYNKILFYFASKCKYLQQLDFTESCISVPNFVNFLQSCSDCLTHLRLSSCRFVDELSLLNILEICKKSKNFLFKCLNLRNLKKEYSKDSSFCYDKILFYFASKCKYLQQLDLTRSCISATDFVNFLQSCGDCLTHLRLKDCEFVDELCLLKILEICKNLKVLDLSYCIFLEGIDQKVSSFKNLEFLEKLDLEGSPIRTESLCKILQKTRRMRNLNLRMPGYIDEVELLDLDAITIQLKNSCPDLEIINLSGCSIITSRGIHALAECKNLRKLTMMDKNDMYPEDRSTIDKHSLSRLFFSCQCLEEVNLRNSDIIFNYDVYEELTMCKNLRQIYLGYTSNFAILEQFPKLQTIYVMRAGNAFDDTRDSQTSFVAQVKEKYPHVSILEYQKGIK